MRSSVLNRVLTSIVREETFVSSIMTDLVTVNVSRNDTKNLSEIQSLKRITLDHAVSLPLAMTHSRSYGRLIRSSHLNTSNHTTRYSFSLYP
jgi:hypothetical protein